MARRAAAPGAGRARLIRLLKWGLPVVVLGLAAAVFLTSRGAERDEAVSGFDIARLGAGLRIDNPRFAGRTKDGEPFSVTADWALPDGPEPQEVELSAVEGEMTLSGGRRVEVSAERGMLYRNDEALSLSQDVVIEIGGGYRVEAASARLDIDDGAFSAEGPLTGTGPEGLIEAGRMRAERDGAAGLGDYIWFEDGVRVRIERPAG